MHLHGVTVEFKNEIQINELVMRIYPYYSFGKRDFP